MSTPPIDDDPLRAPLRDLAELACHGVAGCASASVTVQLGGRVRTLVASSAAAETVDRQQYAAGDGPCVTALRRGTPVEVDDYTEDDRWPQVARTAVGQGLRSSLSLPLRDDRRVLGALNMHGREPRAFGDEARRVADVLVRQAVAAISYLELLSVERTERIAERRISDALQHSLIPDVPDLPGMTCATRYLVGAEGNQVGGDWFDVFPLPDGAFGVAIGDVMGHDLEAAVAMGQLRSVLRSYAYDGSTPSAVLDRLDRLVQGFGMTQLASAFYGRLVMDRDGAMLLFGNAGHPPPLLLRPDGAVQQLHGGVSPLIGAPPAGATSRSDAGVLLPAGSTLVLYTDGLVERKEADLGSGLERLASTVAAHAPQDPPEALCDRLVATMLPHGHKDDVALLAVQIT